MAFAPILAVSVLASPATALEMAQCDRVTHVSHGGEDMHMDAGDGWVTWNRWWSQEGVSSDLHVADCRAQRLLVTRLQEARIRGTVEYDRRDEGLEVLDRHLRRAPALRSLDELAEVIGEVGENTQLGPMIEQACACAAAYPQDRRALTPFALN